MMFRLVAWVWWLLALDRRGAGRTTPFRVKRPWSLALSATSTPPSPPPPRELYDQTKDQSVRKLLDMLNSRSISPRQAKLSFETVLSNWPDFELSETGWFRLLDGAIRWRFSGFAVRIFEVMTDQGVVCPSYLMTSMLQLVSLSGMNDVALRLFDSAVAAGFEPSVHNFSPLLKSCGTAQKARELLQRMEFVGIQANVISYTAAIKSCESTGDWRSALELLDLMRAASVYPNEITFCCVINVASRGLAGDVAVNVLREMLDLGFMPNILCYGSALTACAKIGMWKEVEMLLAEMEQYGLPLQESVIISVINACRGQPPPTAGGERWGRPEAFYPSSPRVLGEETLRPLDTVSASASATTATATATATIGAFGDGGGRLDSAANGPPLAPTADELELRVRATACQWSRTQWIIARYGLKVANVTESMYTMAMDVCESVRRYREVLSIYELMLSQGVLPSKSSFTFALRACTALSDGDEVVRCVRLAQAQQSTTPFMYNATIVLLDTLKRNDLVVSIYRDMLAQFTPDGEEDVPSAASHTSTYVPGGGPSYGPPHSREQPYGSSRPTAAPAATHPAAGSRGRAPPAWLTRRVINNALTDLTAKFSEYFTEIKNGRLAPSRAAQSYVRDVTELLKETIHDRNVFLIPNAYPMANKLVLDAADWPTLRNLLNQTLYKAEVNSTRLYDFAVKVLVRDNPDRAALDTALGFVADVRAAGFEDYAAYIVIDVMNKLLNARMHHNHAMAVIAHGWAPADADVEAADDAADGDARGRDRGNLGAEGSDDVDATPSPRPGPPQNNRDAPFADLARAHLVSYFFDRARGLFKPDRACPVDPSFPRKAYNIAAYMCKRADDPRLMMWVYRLAVEDGADDKMLRNIIIHTLARSRDHWDTAIEIIEDMPRPDLFMYNSALIACNTGKDWEQALYLLDKMQRDGHALSTVVVTSAIAACSTCGQADEALRLLDMMERDGIPRTVWTFNAVMSACAKSGRWKDALAVFEKMRDGSASDAAVAAAAAMGAEEGDEGDGWDAHPREALEEPIAAVANAPAGNAADEEDDDDNDEDEDEDGGGDAEDDGDVDEGEGLFTAMRGVANRVTYNTLIEALAQGGQAILVDELYKEAVASGVVSPLRSFAQKGLVDLHGHSAHMAVAALRYTFEHLLESAAIADTRRRPRELTVIVGKGGKLSSVIQRTLHDDFRPSIRSYVSQTNSGRLLLSEKDTAAWLNVHKRTATVNVNA